MATTIPDNDESIILTQPANTALRLNLTSGQFEPIGDYVPATSRNSIDAFLSSLSVLERKELKEDDERECPVCTESYRHGSERGRDDEGPVRLACGHVIGRECLEKWLYSSVRNRNNNTVCWEYFLLWSVLDMTWQCLLLEVSRGSCLS